MMFLSKQQSGRTDPSSHVTEGGELLDNKFNWPVKSLPLAKATQLVVTKERKLTKKFNSRRQKGNYG